MSRHPGYVIQHGGFDATVREQCTLLLVPIRNDASLGTLIPMPCEALDDIVQTLLTHRAVLLEACEAVVWNWEGNLSGAMALVREAIAKTKAVGS